MTSEPVTLIETRDAIASRRFSAVEATRSALARAKAAASLNAFTEVYEDEAMRRAAEIDAAITNGQSPGRLAGVPIAVKDNLCTAFGRTTCGSRILENYRSPYTATAVQRLIDAGAVVIAKTNLDEFAMGGSSERSIFGPVRNPRDESRVAGGGSGGSAAAVAAGIVPVSLGSDTGGSIRQPAGFCGVVGLKPTYGRVSRYGLVAFASSLDQIGPFGRTCADVAELLGVISGHDPRDSTSAQLPLEDFATHVEHPVDGLTLGVPRQARSEANSPGVTRAFDAAIETYRGLGAKIVEIDLPHSPQAVAAYYIIATAEASSNLARFDGIRYGRRAALKPGEGLADLYARSRSEGFGPEVQRRIMLGTHVLSSGYYEAYYLTALKVRRLVKQDYDAAFASPLGCHAILMPASPGPAFKLGEKLADPLAMYLEDVYTVGVNLAGLPGLTIPAGVEAMPDGKNLPIGMQLIGPALSEAVLLRIGRMFEKATAPKGARIGSAPG